MPHTIRCKIPLRTGANSNWWAITPWIFKVKYWNCCNLGMGGSTHLEWNMKIQGQGHGWGQSLNSQCESNILSTQIPFVPCQSAIPFLSYSIFKILTWKSKVKVMSEVDIESHKVGVASYRLISLSFHVNRPSHSWDTTFSKFDLENPR